MKIVIMMATYNGEKFIKDQIESIISQTVSDWVLYINDDGSQDNTISIVEEYCEKYPEKIVLMKNETDMHGAASNFFELMQKVPKAEWYALCDQDDIWYEDRLEKMILAAESSEHQEYKTLPVIVFGQAEVVDEKLNLICDSLVECIGIDFSKHVDNLEIGIHTFFNAIHGCTMIYNSILHEKVLKTLSLELVYEMSYLRGHDSWLTEVCAWFGKIIYLEQKVIRYRQHSQSVTGEGKRIWKSFLEQLVNKRDKFNKVRAYRVRMIKKIELFENIFEDELSVQQKEQIERLLSTICHKSRIYSLCNGWKNGYWGKKGTNPYNIVLFLIRKEPK